MQYDTELLKRCASLLLLPDSSGGREILLKYTQM